MADFFGNDGVDPFSGTGVSAPAGATKQYRAKDGSLWPTKEAAEERNRAIDYVETRTAEQRAQDAYERGNIGGAAGAYNAGSDATRAAFDEYHKNNQGGVNWSAVKDVAGDALKGAYNITTNPAGTVLGAVGAPKWMQVAANPVGALSTVATGGVASPSAGGRGTSTGGAGAGAAGYNGTVQTPTGGGRSVELPSTADVQAEIDNNTTSYREDMPDPTEQEPAEVDREKIDALLNNVLRATSGLQGIAENEREFSEAQAQLALGTAQAQQNALALARSGNRRDAAALGARALQTNAELGAEATRSAALLRAQEEDADRRLRMDAYNAAANLGLNAAALEVDVNRLNMDSATNYLNQLFETNRVGMQLDQREAERVTNYVRDMALIAKDYYALDQDERQSIRDDLTRRYGIDKQLQAVLEQLDAEPGFWEKAALGIIGGAGAEATKVGLPLLLASDKRVKTAVKDTTDQELEELLSSVSALTYKYKKPEQHGGGRQFGGMAQDLEKSKLGAGMVKNAGDGTKMVDGGKAGMAALAAVSMIYDKLKELEAAI